MAEITASELMDQRYTDRMGILLAKAEKRTVAAEVTVEYLQQQISRLEQENEELRSQIPEPPDAFKPDTVLDEEESEA